MTRGNCSNRTQKSSATSTERFAGGCSAAMSPCGGCVRRVRSPGPACPKSVGRDSDGGRRRNGEHCRADAAEEAVEPSRGEGNRPLRPRSRGGRGLARRGVGRLRPNGMMETEVRLIRGRHFPPKRGRWRAQRASRTATRNVGPTFFPRRRQSGTLPTS